MQTVNSSQSPWDFFIAHAGKDTPLAEELDNRLYPTSRTYLDRKCLLPGDDFDRELSRAQRDSRITVVLVSKHTDQAYYQREEIANAIAMARKSEMEHRLVPVIVSGDCHEELAMPYGLRLKHSVKLSDVGGVDGVARKLLELLAKMNQMDHPKADFNTLSGEELGLLFVLKQIPQGLPAGVVTEAVCIGADHIADKLAAFITVVQVDGETLYTLTKAPIPEFSHPNSEKLLARILEELIGYISQHKRDRRGARYVETALTIAKRCKDSSPRAAHKLIRRSGYHPETPR